MMSPNNVCSGSPAVAPEPELPWTGERLTTSLSGQIAVEHLHRYAIAVQLAKGKDILDIACGEGYGSHLLAGIARSVVGVDIAAEAVAHASRKYCLPNLRFLEGSCASIPLPDASIDLAVSFETIEHVEEQDVFLAELVRVLRPGGTLLISTPEKVAYNKGLHSVNKFHLKELTGSEFQETLLARFKNISLLPQRSGFFSVVLPQTPGEQPAVGAFRGNFRDLEFSRQLGDAVFLLALCSDSPLPAVDPTVFEWKPVVVDNGYPARPPMFLQLFCDAGEGYSELSSVVEPLVPNEWRTIRIPQLQERCKRGRLRLDPVNLPSVIRISGLKIVSDTHGVVFKAETAAEFEKLSFGQEVYLRMDGTEAVLTASGGDPQVFFPPMNFSRWGECSLEIALKIDTDPGEVLRSFGETLDDERVERARLKAAEARLKAKGGRLQVDAEYLRSALRTSRDSAWQLQESVERLERIVDSAEQWQRRSWFKRAFHRWRFHGAGSPQDDSAHGFLRKLGKAVRKLQESIRKRVTGVGGGPAADGKAKKKCRKNGAGNQQSSSPVRFGHDSTLHAGGATLHLSDPPTPPPSVTVIVPNFNHAPYLRQRLDSIYQQTYRQFNVLLMDDCSTDGSLEILTEYQARYPEITQLIVNEVNGGSAFAQWKKGLERASGELIWIAESDDWCDANFLETLTPFFGDEALKLAYCKTTFVDSAGAPMRFTFENYTKAISPTKWNEDYVQTAHTEVSQALGIRNTIPNASSVVFRKPSHLSLFEDKDWTKMKICGDWVFYLHVIRGGKLGFSRKTNNYYRYHSQNTSTVRNQREFYYYKEHETVARTVARLYAVEPDVLETFRSLIADHCHHIFKNEQKPNWTFNDAFKMEAVLDECQRRLPNVMVVSHDFSTGGGEMAAIRLATAFHQEGYAVTFFDFNAHPAEPQFRRNLPPEIPVIQRNKRLRDFGGLVAGFGIEVINTHHGSSDRFFADVCRRIRQSEYPLLAPRLVVTMHGMYESNPAILKDYGDTLRKNVDHWIYVADKNVAPFKARGWFSKEKFTKTWAPAIVPLKGGPKAASVGRETLGIPAEAFVVCVASRAIEGKGWRESIQIVEAARARCGKDIHLLLLGQGPVADALSATALPPYVHLLGFQSNITDYYALADMGLLATTYPGESTPLTVIECLGMGKPFIATDCGEVRRMLLDDSGESAGAVFAAPDGKIPVEIVAGLVACYAGNPEEYAKVAKRATNAAAKFDIRKTVQIFKEVFASVLA